MIGAVSSIITIVRGSSYHTVNFPRLGQIIYRSSTDHDLNHSRPIDLLRVFAIVYDMRSSFCRVGAAQSVRSRACLLGSDLCHADPAQPLAAASEELDGLTADDISVDDISVDDLSVDDISVDDLSVDDISIANISVDDLSADEISVDGLSVDDLSEG